MECQYSGHDADWPCVGTVALYQHNGVGPQRMCLCENAVAKAQAAGVDVQPVPFTVLAS